MSSTKQRQALARSRRHAARAEQRISELNRQSAEITFRPIGPKEYIPMKSEFLRDYRAAGDTAPEYLTSEDIDRLIKNWDSSGQVRQAIHYQGNKIGYVETDMTTLRNPWTNEPIGLLQVIYIKPEYRGLGLAGSVYRSLINSGVIRAIELSYHRVANRTGFWTRAGFGFIQPVPNQCGSDKALCLLTTDLGMPLTYDSVKHLRTLADQGQFDRVGSAIDDAKMTE